MAIVFDPAQKRIVLDSASVSAAEIFSRWEDWIAAGDNAKYLPAFRQVGGDDLGGGLSIPAYFFLQNGWRVRPMEAHHTLTLNGNLFTDDGTEPVVATIGSWRVLTRLIVPVQAQTVNIGGGGGSAGLTAAQAEQLLSLAKVHGLIPGSPLVVTPTSRSAGDLAQSVQESAGAVTVERTA